MPKISVIIPSYNCKEYLGRAIDSVLDQSFSDFEIIVVDDASTDGSAELLHQKYGQNEKVTILVNEKNKKLGAARNRGLDIAKGEYIFFLDADDWLEQKCFAELLTLAEKEQADVVGCGINIVAEGENPMQSHGEVAYYAKRDDIIQGFIDGTIREVVWNKLYHRSVIEKGAIQFIEPHFHEDHIFTFKILHSCKKYVSTNRAYHNYFQRDNSIVNQKKTDFHLESYFRFIVDGFSFLSNIDFEEDSPIRKKYETVVLLKFVVPFIKRTRKYFGDFSKSDDAKFLDCAKKMLTARDSDFYNPLLVLVKNNEITEEDIFAFLKHALITREQLKNVANGKVAGREEFLYTVVSPVKNHQAYLDNYLESLTGQTLGFREKIKVILVDYGSTDDSEKMIKCWQRAYPNNISYIKIKGGSRAEAKNFGLQSVDTEWVTFISPGDSVAMDYFEKVTVFKIKQEEQDICLMTGRPLFFNRRFHTAQDVHPLKLFFEQDHLVQANELEGKFPFSAENSFFLVDALRKQQLDFDESTGEFFEDLHFIGKFLLLNGKRKVAFLSGAEYYFRDSDSVGQLKTIFEKKSCLSDFLKNGCLNLLSFSKKKRGEVPKCIQQMVVYKIFILLRFLLKQPMQETYFSRKEKVDYLKLFKEVGIFLDNKLIAQFSLAGCWLYFRVALMSLLKNEDLAVNVVVVDRYDEEREQLRAKFFSYDSKRLKLFSEKDSLNFSYQKTKVSKVFGKVILREDIFWIATSNISLLKMKIGDKWIDFSVNGKYFPKELPVKDAIRELAFKIDKKNLPSEVNARRAFYQQSQWQKKYGGAWLLIDSDEEAGGSAEQLYRYIKKKHLEIKPFFVLRRDAEDWNRLKEDGFNLIAFGSVEHSVAFLHCRHIIFSQVQSRMANYLPKAYYGDLVHVKKTFLCDKFDADSDFLQLDSLMPDCIVVNSRAAYNVFASAEGLFSFTAKEMVLAELFTEEKDNKEIDFANYQQKIFNAIKNLEGIELQADKELQFLIEQKDSWLEELATKRKQASKKPDFSVIVACYNAGENLKKTIASILAQTHQNFELIVVDDASTDEKTIAALGEIENYCTVLRLKKNGGPAKARNLGISNAKGRYIIYIDSDDLVSQFYLEKAHIAFESNKKLGVVAPSLRLFGDFDGFYNPLEHFSIQELLASDRLPGQSCFRREIYDAVGGYDENLRTHEDWDFWIKVFSEFPETEVVVLPEKLYFYQIHGKSSSQSLDKLKMKKAMSYLFSKHSCLYESFGKEIVSILHAQNTLSRFDGRDKLVQVEKLRQDNLHLQQVISDKAEQVVVKNRQMAWQKNNLEDKDNELAAERRRLEAQERVLHLKERQIYDLIIARDDLLSSKSFRLGSLFFRSIKHPWKLITFPINLIRLFLDK